MGIAIQTLSEGLREAANHSGGVALCRLRLPLPQSGNRLPRRGSITRSRVLRTLLQPASRGVLVLSGRTLACGRGVRITLAGTFVDRGEGRHAPKRHRQRQHQRRDQQRNTLSHRFSPPFLLSKNKKPASKDHNVIPSVAGCTTGSLNPRCPYRRDEVLSLY